MIDVRFARADGDRLVEALAARWAVLDRLPIGKTVRAELDFPQRAID